MSGLIGVNAPVRLLREQWGSATDLAQELYAMFTATGPTEIRDTVTIRVPNGRPALRIERSAEGDTLNSQTSHSITKAGAAPTPAVQARRPPASSSTDARRTAPGFADEPASATFRSSPRTQTAPSRSFSETPLVEIDGSVSFTGHTPVQFSEAPILVNPRTGQSESLVDAVARRVPSTPDTTPRPMFGVVASGEGDTYLVDLYGQGPGGGVTLKNATVKIPQIDPSEKIDAGTWLSGIQKFGDGYWVQPPVWVS